METGPAVLVTQLGSANTVWSRNEPSHLSPVQMIHLQMSEKIYHFCFKLLV